MWSIALNMLFGNKAKYLIMIAGVTIATCMMTHQSSVFIGFMSRTYSFIKDAAEPDIWVMHPGVKYVEQSHPLRDIELLKVKGINGVRWAVPMFNTSLKAKLPDGSFANIGLIGLDNTTLIGAPYNIISGKLSDFRRPEGIFVDVNSANTTLKVKDTNGLYRPLHVGDIMEISNNRAIVVGLVKSTRNFILQPQVFTTYSNALTYLPLSQNQMGYILVKAKDGVNHINLSKKISDITGLKAQTSDEFKRDNLNYWIYNTGIPINFGIAVILGFVVGTAITGQTFYAFILENRKNYAVLKVMGANELMLIKIIVLQACTVGGIGYGIGVGLTSLFGIFFQDSILAFRMPPSVLFFSALSVLLINLLSSFVAIKKILSIDPAIVFNGSDNE